MCKWYIGRAKQKRVFGHMRAAKAQISLRIRAVWSGPSLSANKIIGYYRMYEWRAKARMILCACKRWSKSANFEHVRRHVFAWGGPYDTQRKKMDLMHDASKTDPEQIAPLQSWVRVFVLLFQKQWTLEKIWQTEKAIIIIRSDYGWAGWYCLFQ